MTRMKHLTLDRSNEIKAQSMDIYFELSTDKLKIYTNHVMIGFSHLTLYLAFCFSQMSLVEPLRLHQTLSRR